MAPTDPRRLPGWDQTNWKPEWYRTDFYALLGAHPRTASLKNIRDSHLDDTGRVRLRMPWLARPRPHSNAAT